MNKQSKIELSDACFFSLKLLYQSHSVEVICLQEGKAFVEIFEFDKTDFVRILRCNFFKIFANFNNKKWGSPSSFVSYRHLKLKLGVF